MRFIIFILSVFIYVSAFANSPVLDKKAEKLIITHFSLYNIELKEIEELKTSKDLFIKVIENNIEKGFVVLSSAKGRLENFEFIVIYSLDFKIEYIKILNYKSQYGSEITSKNWLKQFYKKMKSEFVYGTDIQAISGATFSAMSLTKSINRISQLLKEHNNH